MRRRELLAAAAVGIGATAGCGYAHGGGDVRGKTRLTAGGFRNESFYDVGADRIARAASGRQWVRTDGELEYAVATGLTVWTSTGERLWSHSHGEPSRGVALGSDVYLLEETDRVVAIGASARDGPTPTDADADPETARRWRVDVGGARSPLAADDRGAYVARAEGLLAVREGAVAWDVDLPGPVESLRVADDAVLASTPGAVVALSTGGRERWRIGTDGTPAVAAAAGRAAVRDGGGLTVVRIDDGRRLWSDNVGDAGERPAATDEGVYVLAGGRIGAFDAESGDERWTTAGRYDVSPPLVPAPEGVYAVGDGEAVGVDGDGERWRRELDDAVDAVAGWLDGETVAFLLSSGELWRLQRTDRPAPGSV